MDPLSAQDASFLHIEAEVSHMHIGSAGIFEGPAPTREELCAAVEGKLHLVPRYRQKVRFPPLHVGPPVWIDDAHFNLDYHVRRTALASPGGEDELRALVGRVMSQQLDRTKALWEMWVAEGLGAGRWALVSNTHHCMVDGVAATDLLLSRGEHPARLVVRTLVPVSVRRPSDRGTYNNRVSAMYAELPIGIEDPIERLESVRMQMDGLKRSQQAVAGEVLVSLSGFAPAVLLALGTRLALRFPQRSLNTVTTNVPGPQRPLYLTGRRMLEAVPFVPLAGQVRIGVAIFSYDGSLKFGVTGDYDTASDIGVLCEGIETGMDELMASASKVRGPGAEPGRARARPTPSSAPPSREPGSRA